MFDEENAVIKRIFGGGYNSVLLCPLVGDYVPTPTHPTQLMSQQRHTHSLQHEFLFFYCVQVQILKVLQCRVSRTREYYRSF